MIDMYFQDGMEVFLPPFLNIFHLIYFRMRGFRVGNSPCVGGLDLAIHVSDLMLGVESKDVCNMFVTIFCTTHDDPCKHKS